MKPIPMIRKFKRVFLITSVIGTIVYTGVITGFTFDVHDRHFYQGILWGITTYLISYWLIRKMMIKYGTHKEWKELKEELMHNRVKKCEQA